MVSRRSHWEDSLRPCLAPPIAPLRRARFRQALLRPDRRGWTQIQLAAVMTLFRPVVPSRARIDVQPCVFGERLCAFLIEPEADRGGANRLEAVALRLCLALDPAQMLSLVRECLDRPGQVVNVPAVLRPAPLVGPLPERTADSGRQVRPLLVPGHVPGPRSQRRLPVRPGCHFLTALEPILVRPAADLDTPPGEAARHAAVERLDPAHLGHAAEGRKRAIVVRRLPGDAE